VGRFAQEGRTKKKQKNEGSAGGGKGGEEKGTPRKTKIKAHGGKDPARKKLGGNGNRRIVYQGETVSHS